MNDNTLKSGSLLKHGEYRIIHVLGQGGFGITYEAEQVSLGRKVAVKEFFMKDSCERNGSTSHMTVPTASNRELVSKFKDKFIREARMIAALDHEHIVKIFDVFEENGTAYYVMEHLGGGSLDKQIKDKGAMSESVALNFIRQIASALEYLHSQNILHFDVKPSNVLLGKNGSAKLIDFGISKHYDEAGVQTSSTPVGISKGYAPLEQYQQGSDIKSFTPATDIYALGATLYALLSGSNPPEASIVNEDGVPVIEGISPNVMRVIEKAMQPRRKDRPQSVAEFLALLDGTTKEDDDEETVIPGTEDKGKPKYDKEKKPAKSEKLREQHKQEESEESEKKPFPKWLFWLFAGVAVAVLVAVLLNRSGKPDVSDLPQIDSTSVVSEAVPQKPATGKPSSSSTKPEISARPESPVVIELKSIALNKSALELEEGGIATLTVKYNPSDVTDKTTTWKSSNTSVAKVSTNGKVTAIKAGSAAIIATCGGKDAYCNVTVRAESVQPSSSSFTATSASPSSGSTVSTTGTNNGHECVDLGLSVKWATCNVGATKPEGYGSYFAWGETRPKSDYSWSTLKYCNDESGDSYSKYNQSKGGTRDGRTRLEMTDDAARANWGGSWRMPTKSEFNELLDKCTWIWTTMNGKNGYKVASKSNGNSIFLPAAGCHYVADLLYAGRYGYYWSASLDEERSCWAWDLNFASGGYSTSPNTRLYGRSVRPVCP